MTTSDRGQEYLLIVSAANEVRVWDLEARFHLAAFVLGGLRAKQTALVAATVTTGFGRCILLYSKGGSSQVGCNSTRPLLLRTSNMEPSLQGGHLFRACDVG